MRAYNKNPESTRIVRFQDCDPYGHLNNSKYIDYLLNVREDHLREHYALDVFAMAARDKVSWLVGHNDIVYLRPADVMEEVVVRTALIDYTNRFVKAEMAMMDSERGHIKAVLWTKFFYFDFGRGTGIRHTEAQMELFAQLKLDGDLTDVESRAKALNRGLRKAAAS